MRWFWAVLGILFALALFLVPRAPAVSSEGGSSPRSYAPLVVADRALTGRGLPLIPPMSDPLPIPEPVTVLSNSSVFTRADGAGVQVLGEVQNNTGDWISAAFTATLYHENKAIAYTRLGTTTLPPYSRGCISNVMPPPPQDWDRYDFTLYGYEVSSFSLTDMQVVELEAAYSPPYVSINGRLLNDTSGRLLSGEVIVWLYDEAGKVLACGRGGNWTYWPRDAEKPVSVTFEEGIERATYSDVTTVVFYTVAHME